MCDLSCQISRNVLIYLGLAFACVAILLIAVVVLVLAYHNKGEKLVLSSIDNLIGRRGRERGGLEQLTIISNGVL